VSDLFGLGVLGGKKNGWQGGLGGVSFLLLECRGVCGREQKGWLDGASRPSEGLHVDFRTTVYLHILLIFSMQRNTL